MSTATSHAVGERTVGERTPTRTAARAAGSTGSTVDDRQGTAEADNLAVASFLLGLPGLLLFNIVLGPIAITLATLALVRGTSRRGRAFLGLVLGIASVTILAVTTATSHGVLIDLGS
ncbi:DUF4190 domain-containing protein [Kitasatospora sp. NPDC089797]|uniref:DUF4190 domain-containing protein n=1 Tax=Kitasatospora sp. NPDC089797 TaxID=3155298 RepID=UPI003441D581